MAAGAKIRGGVTGAVAAAALLTGCTHAGPGHGSGPHHGAPGQPDATEQVAAGIDRGAAERLCSELDGQLSSMRTYTVTPGRVTLNTTVASWATGNGIDLLALSRDRDRVDTALIAVCPQTRDEVLTALELPTIAAGLVGF